CFCHSPCFREPAGNQCIQLETHDLKAALECGSLGASCLTRERGAVEHQNTVASPASLSGIGLHTGVPVTVRLCPAASTTRIVFPHPLIGEQSLEFVTSQGKAAEVGSLAADYETAIAPARTFGFIEEVEKLRRNGLIRGGSLKNAVVLTRDGVMNPEGLRFP